MISPEEKSNLIVGYKQVLKALSANSCKKLFLTEDCSENIRETLASKAEGVEIINIETMRELGTLCEIDVPASCAAIRL